MRLSFAVITLSLLMCSSVASAQVSFGGDEPIDVKAERAAYKGPKTVLSGDVEIVQGTSRINANEMDLLRKKLNDDEQGLVKYGNINLIIAKGKFKYITPQNSVVGDKGVYERDKNIITVTGNVTFTQDSGNTVSGDKLIYDLTTNRASFDSNCDGTSCADDERVSITIGQQ